MKNIKRAIKWLALFVVVYLGVVIFLIGSGGRETPANNADTVIVLGAQVRGRPAYPSPVLKERLDATLTYLKKNKVQQIIVCGGQGPDESASEAVVMRDYLVSHGVRSEQIVLEDQSTRTKENIHNAQMKGQLGKTVIVSNDFHMYRALLLANRLGIRDTSGLVAKSQTSDRLKSHLREILALGYGLLFDW